MPVRTAKEPAMHRRFPALLCAALLLGACDKPASERADGPVKQHVDEMKDLAERSGEKAEAAARQARDKTDRALQDIERGD